MTETTWTPDTLAAWRDFVSYQADRPHVLTVKERDALTPLLREQYDDSRIAFVNAPIVLPTPDLERLIREARIITGMNRGPQFTARLSLAISGTQTLGKSTAALYLGRAHEERERAKHAREGDKSFVPVLYVSTPPQTSPKGLMVRFASTLGIPVRSSTTTDQAMDRVVDNLRELQTSMVILDEVQHLRTRAQAGMEAASALKSFSERVPATFLYVGVDLPRSDFLGGAMGAQMQGRTTMVQMQPYSIGSETHRKEWDKVIALFEREFPLVEHEVGTLMEEAAWLHAVTGGVLGSLRTLLRKGLVAAIIDGHEHLDRRALEQVIPDYRAVISASNEHKSSRRASA
ncbi:TniB family NTP-binding protein [Nostocoides veronense]|uniref:TniB protein n=1 Tax=Nostocoides veronense TaxID=330836 RepID=A0ABN2LEL3_9MICO